MVTTGRISKSRRRARRALVAVLVVLVVLVLSLLVGVRLYMFPSTDELDPADPPEAIVALGGPWETAVFAFEVARRQPEPPVVVLSDPFPSDDVIRRTMPAVPERFLELRQDCNRRHQGVLVLCFQPRPATTQGEARQIAALSREYGWTRVAVAAPAYHVSRARLIVRRCYPGELLMLRAPVETPASWWAYEFAYQTGGYLKTAIQREC